MPVPSVPTTSYQTLEEIQLRKSKLKADIQGESKKIDELWHELTAPQPAGSTGELIANIVANSITAIDAFLLVRKLTKTYGSILGLFRKKKH